MEPGLRVAALAVGLLFCLAFAYMTIVVAIDSAFDIFSLVALIIVVMIGGGLIGALRNPPED